MPGLSPSHICAEFCPLGTVCNGNTAASPKLILRAAAEEASIEVPGIDGDELTGFVNRLDHCSPQKIGEVVLDGDAREVYECPASELSNEKRQFIF